MNFEKSEEQREIVDTIRKVIENQLPRSRQRELDQREEFPTDVWSTLADLGVLAGPIPVEYGGLGIDFLTNIMVLEELSFGFSPLGLGFLVFGLLSPSIIAHAASEEVKREFLPEIAAGRLRVAFAITEPQGGTDVLAMKMQAVQDGNQYILNGQKLFITGADIADEILTIARTHPPGQKKSDGLTIFLVNRHSPGVEIRRLKKLGGKSLSVTEVFYSDVVIPESRVLGNPGSGWKCLLPSLNDERIATATVALGIAEAALSDSRTYALQRESFGRPIGQYQAIQHYLADMAISVEAARLLVYKAAWLRTVGRPCDLEAHLAKVFATETAFTSASRGMDIYAGHGFVLGHDMERHFRDSRQYTFGPVSNEMARNYIAQKMGMPRSY